jgi:phage host-nuclease inhibitor protein Gam
MKTQKSKSPTRLKLPTHQAPIIRSRADLEVLTREVAELTLARNKQQIELDQAITKLREGYELIFTDLDQQLALKTESARAWAEANPAEFRGLKSLDLTHAVIGFRTGQPQLKPLRGQTWASILDLVKIRLGAKWLRIKEEVNREKIIADRKMITNDGLTALGLKIVQDESFYIEPKLDQPENRQTLKAAA